MSGRAKTLFVAGGGVPHPPIALLVSGFRRGAIPNILPACTTMTALAAVVGEETSLSYRLLFTDVLQPLNAYVVISNKIRLAQRYMWMLGRWRQILFGSAAEYAPLRKPLG